MEKKLFQNLKTKNYLKNQKNFLLKLKKLTKINQNLQSQIDSILSSIPNLPLSDVPIGQDENANVEIEKKVKLKSLILNQKPTSN